MAGIALGLSSGTALAVGLGLTGAAGLTLAGTKIAAGSKQRKEGKRQRREAMDLQVANAINEAEAAQGKAAPTTMGLISASSQNLEELQKTGSRVLSGYEEMAREGLPEEAYLAQQEAIDRSASMGVQYLQGSRAGIRGIGSLAQGTIDAYRQLNAMDAQARLQNRQTYLSAQAQQQQLENQARTQFGTAQQQEALRRQGLMYNLYGIGMQNIISGIENQGEGAAQALMVGGNAVLTANQAGLIGNKSTPQMNPYYNVTGNMPTKPLPTNLGSTGQMQPVLTIR